MFVRKGTISRKGRGSGRRSVRRPASSNRETSNSSGTPRKSIIHDDPASAGSGSGSVRFDQTPTRSASFRSENPHSRAGSFRSTDSGPCPSESYQKAATTEDRYQVLDETNNLQLPIARPSPAKSVANTVVSYDEEKRLVRTSVGWSSRHMEEQSPDYGALLYQIDEASKEAEHVLDYLAKITTILCNTLFVTFLVGISMALPIAMISVGVKYLNDCPKQPCIPIYLLVGGCFGMLKVLSSLWRNIQHRRHQDVELVFDDHDTDGVSASATYKTMDVLLALFLLGWQITGTYWVYQIWKPLFKQLLHEPSNWCDETVYMFAIYQIVGCYIVMGIVVLVYCFMCVCYKCSPFQRW